MHRILAADLSSRQRHGVHGVRRTLLALREALPHGVFHLRLAARKVVLCADVVHLRLRERKLRVDDVEHDAFTRAVLLACDEVVLLRLVYGVLRRVQTVFRLLHRKVRRADVVVHIVPVLFQLQPRGIERRFRRLDARFLSVAVKDVPIHIEACRHAAAAGRRRLEVLVRRRAQ